MKSSIITVLKFLIGWPLALLAIYYIYTVISPHANDILPRLLDIHPGMLITGMLCFIIFYIIRGYIWHEILHYYSYDFPFCDTLFLWGFSELKRYIPGNIWSFLGRSILFRERGVSKQHLATSFLIEAQLFVLGAMLMSTLAVTYALHLYRFAEGPLTVGVIIGAVVLGCLIFVGNKYLLAGRKVQLIILLATILPPFSSRKNLRLLIIAAIAMLFYGIGNFFVVSSVLALPLYLFWILSGFFVLALLIGYLSIIAPTGLGVREGVVILLLKNFTQTGLAGFLALFSRVILITSEIIFLILAYILHKTRNASTRR